MTMAEDEKLNAEIEPPALAALFPEMQAGFEWGLSRTVTDAEIALIATLTGDNNPFHLDEEFARASVFKGRIASASLVLGLMFGPMATYFQGKAVGLDGDYRIHNALRAGDTLTIRWRALNRKYVSKLRGTVVEFEGTGSNQNGITVITMHHSGLMREKF